MLTFIKRIFGRSIITITLTLICNGMIAQSAVQVNITGNSAKIENDRIAVVFDLSDGTYSGLSKQDDVKMFKNAWYRIGDGGSDRW